MSDGYTDSGDETRQARYAGYRAYYGGDQWYEPPLSDPPPPAPPTAHERDQLARTYADAQRVAPGLWAVLAGPPHVIYHYPTDSLASGRPVPNHLWTLGAQVAAVNALPSLLAALATAEGDCEYLSGKVQGLEVLRNMREAELTAERAHTQNQAVIIAGLETEVDRLRALVLPPPGPYDPEYQCPMAIWDGKRWTQDLGNTE